MTRVDLRTMAIATGIAFVLAALFDGYATPLMTLALDQLSYCF